MQQKWMQRIWIWVVIAISLIFLWIWSNPIIEGSTGSDGTEQNGEDISTEKAYILCSLLSRMIKENTLDNNVFYKDIIRGIEITDPKFSTTIHSSYATVRDIIDVVNKNRDTLPMLSYDFTYPYTTIPPPPQTLNIVNGGSDVANDVADGIKDTAVAISNGVQKAAKAVGKGIKKAFKKIKRIGKK